MPNTPNSVVVLDQFGRYPPLGGFSGPVPMIGVTDGSNALAGNVGEFMQSVVEVASPHSASNSTPATLTSLSLTPGDWNVWGVGGVVPGASQTDVALIGSISPTTNTLGDLAFSGFVARVSTTASLAFVTPIVRVSISSAASAFIVVEVIWTGGAATIPIFGSISARRVR